MASTFLTVLITHLTQSVDEGTIRYQGRCRIIISRDYLIRLAVKEVASKMVDRGPSDDIYVAPSEKSLAEVNTLVIKKRKISERASISLPVYITGSNSDAWWERAMMLQPDSSTRHAFNMSYIALLHESLKASPSTEPADIGMIAEIVHELRTHQSEAAILVCGTDAGILVLLHEQDLRRCIEKSPNELYISKNLVPQSGTSISSLRRILSKEEGIISDEMWKNFLFFLPTVISAGLPILVMFQYHYKDNPIRLLLNAMDAASTQICIEEDGEIRLRTMPLLQILTRMAGMEEKLIGEIYTSCAGKTSSSRHLSDPNQMGWNQFMLYYYQSTFGASDESMDGLIENRVIMYLSGLMQLWKVYRGELDGNYASSSILLGDAPLAESMAKTVGKMIKKADRVTLPTTYVPENLSTLPPVRNLNRTWPLYIKPCL